MQTLSIAKMTENTLTLTDGEKKRAYYKKTYGPLVEQLAAQSIQDGYMYNNYFEKKDKHYVVKVYNATFNKYYDVLIDEEIFEVARTYCIVVVVHERTGKPVRVEFSKTNHSHARKIPLADMITNPKWMEEGIKSRTAPRPRAYSYANSNVLDLRSKNLEVRSQRDVFRDLLMTHGLYQGEEHFATYYRGILFDETSQCVIGEITYKGATLRTRTFPVDFVHVEGAVRMAVNFVAKNEKKHIDRVRD